jgi:23S rRNA (cytosine1962-C5)-methyltransferase
VGRHAAAIIGHPRWGALCYRAPVEPRPLQLLKDEDRRLRAGHLWVFSNEVDVARTPLTDLEPGEPVTIVAHGGRPLGTGYANPRSLIAARLVSRDHEHPFDAVRGPSLIVHRLKVALALRERLYPTPHYRLVHGESDGLPGLVVDRFGEVLVVQVTTAGMERMREAVLAALHKVVAPACILLRNDVAVRELEGLALGVEVAHGTLPEALEVIEDGLRFAVPARDGQKTGWFYDQRDNRAQLARFVAARRGARVLDLFSYLGGWGLRAAAAGAGEVLCIDASGSAVAGLARNAAANGFRAASDAAGDAAVVTALESDAFEALKALRVARQRFDVVVCDPPAFIKRRKDHREGLNAYHRINQMALQVLAKDGLLVSCSCSHHLGGDELLSVVRAETRHLDRSAQLLATGGAGPDHPVHPAIPETAYLKCLFVRVLPAGF